MYRMFYSLDFTAACLFTFFFLFLLFVLKVFCQWSLWCILSGFPRTVGNFHVLQFTKCNMPRPCFIGYPFCLPNSFPMEEVGAEQISENFAKAFSFPVSSRQWAAIKVGFCLVQRWRHCTPSPSSLRISMWHLHSWFLVPEAAWQSMKNNPKRVNVSVVANRLKAKIFTRQVVHWRWTSI